MKNITHKKNLFEKIFQASAEAIFTVDEDGQILLANPACEALFGYKVYELIGNNIDIIIPEELKEQYKIFFKKQKISKKSVIDIWNIKTYGNTGSIMVGLSPTLVDDKNASILFFRDATLHNKVLKTIEQKDRDLLETSRKYDALINNLDVIVYNCKNSKNFEVDYINQGCLEITGYSPEEFKTNKINPGDLIIAEDRETQWKQIQKALKEKKSYNVEYRIRHKNGSIRHVWSKGYGVYNNKNELVALEGFINDITSRKEIEIELRRSQTKTSALLEAIPDKMFVQDLNGDYLDWYAKNTDELFMPPEEFLGKNMKFVQPPQVFKKIKPAHEVLKKTGETQVVEYSFQMNDKIIHEESRIFLTKDSNILTIVRDITERKAISELLNIRNNALASSINSILIADAQQPGIPIIYCNEAFVKLSGYSEKEILKRNCKFLQQDDRDHEEITKMNNALIKGENCKVLLRNYRKDGTLFWNELTITSIYDDENKLTHFIGVQNDITNKIKEETLKDQTRIILEMMAKNDPIEIIGDSIIETVETHIEHCSASISLLDKRNQTLHELAALNIPKDFSEYFEGILIGPEAASFGTASFLKKEVIVSNIETNILWQQHKDIALKNGIKASWSFPILSSSDRVLGTLNFFCAQPKKPTKIEKEIISNLTHLASVAIENHNNITTLNENKRELEKYAKELEEKVQERTHELMTTVKKVVETNLNLEDQLLITEHAKKIALVSKVLTSQIAKNFPKGLILVVDKDLKVQFVEGEALDQLGLREKIYEGLDINDIGHFSEQRKVLIKDNILKTLSGQHLSFEIKYKGNYFSINTTPMYDDANSIHSALHVYNDISNQKEIEFTIQNALTKERELNDLKSRFVSLASHEFRTPLSAILTSAILIGKQNGETKEHKRDKYVAQIERNVNQLVIILNDFLSLSKLEEGKVEVTLQRFDIIKFFKNLLNETTIGLKKNQKIKLSKNFDRLMVDLDPKLLRHILLNLLSNASKYSPEASKIVVKISRNEENVLIQVDDEGIGIPEEEHKYLFERFFRAKNAVNIEGTGLGLNIVKSYVQLMDGEIGFKSELNGGTTFWVEFPIYDI